MTVGYAKTIYVDQASTADDPDGTSWETAYPTLGDAQDDMETGDTVLVAPGAYECPSFLPGGIELKSRDGAATTFLGVVPAYDGLRIEGFTFQNIRYSYPAPLPYAVVPTESSLVGCIISGCSSDGILLSECELQDCVVSGCSSNEELLNGCKLENSIVSDCESPKDLISGCDLVNCAVVGNTSNYSILGGCHLWNCTVAGNTLLSWFNALDQSCSAWNSILWGNYNVEELEYEEYPWPISVSYDLWWNDDADDYTDLHMTELHDCCVEGIWDIALTLQNEYGLDYDPDALGLIEEPPDFVDLAHGDVRLRTGSPCVDAGSNAWVRGTTDAAGRPRIQDDAVDLGAYEGAVDGFILSVRVIGAGTVSPATAVVPAGGSATFTASESAGRPFQGWSVGGADAGTAAIYTWSDVQADGELVATFGSFSFCVDAASGDDANDGLSWEEPKASIQAAVDTAANGETVLVKPGVYGPVQAGDKTIRIASKDGKTSTIIDGAGTTRCAYLGKVAGRGATLAGFTLRNGNASWDVKVNPGRGGGAYGGTLLDCDVTGNRACEEGGGLANAAAYRCRIVGNRVVEIDEREGRTMDECRVYGGGAYWSSLYNCLVVSNSACLLAPAAGYNWAEACGGGAYYCGTYQCTVIGNTVGVEGGSPEECMEIFGGGITCGWDHSGNIVYGNTANGEPSDAENWEGPMEIPGSLVGVDPLFVDPANGDYRLREDSPAVDVGATDVEEWRGASTTDTDLDGNPRVRGRCIDLGCYESAWSVGRTATVTTPDPVPYSWLDGYRLAGEEGYELAAAAMALNSVNKVWQCYVAGLDPTNETSRFEARISIDGEGKPVVFWTPDLGAARDYTVEGKESLDEDWGDADDGSRFFRVKVSLP